MLTELYIKNLTLIEEMSLSFGPGLTVLTGETGAGKSILLDALYLVVGGRSSTDLIRDGAPELDVTACFFLNEAAQRRINVDEPGLLLRRVIARSGRHRQYVNGMPVTVSQLREVAESLVDFTGQHAQSALLLQKGQLALLDAYAGHTSLLSDFTQYFEEQRALLLQKKELSLDERARANRIDWLRFQLEEITACELKPDELDALLKERETLANANKIRDEASRFLGALSDSDDGSDVPSRLLVGQRALQALARMDTTFERLEAPLSEAIALVDDLCLQVQRRLSHTEENPERLRQVEDRIGDIKQLLRKHGDSVKQVLLAAQTMQAELSSLEKSDESLEALNLALAKVNAALVDAAAKLSDSRKKAALRLAPLVQKELTDLGMPDALFEVEVSTADLSASGADVLRVLFSANRGESANALEKVASGGELSRVMLAIKRVLMTKEATMISVFDEVDAGVGGAIGHAIGEKLLAISNGRQVLCVTHLSQVAALASAHLKVTKSVIAGRTLSQVTALGLSERVGELARMMGGRAVTQLTLQHAKELLEQAGVSP